MAYTLQQLSDLEEIKQLKHRYFRCIDTGNEAELGTLFTQNVTIDLRGGGYRLQVQGRKEMVDFIASSFNSDVIAQHHGHSPEIAFLGDDEATGLWYLEDRFIDTVRGIDTIGTALYRDRYLRIASEWKIAASEYDRVYELEVPIDQHTKVTAHLLAQTGRKAERRIDISPYLQWFETKEEANLA